jgi:hypothetical protein
MQDASKNKEKTNLESSQIKNCECVQKQNESKSGIIWLKTVNTSESKLKEKLE